MKAMIALNGLMMAAAGCAPVPYQQPVVDGYSIHQCVQNLSASPRRMLRGKDLFEPDTPVLYNRCSNKSFALRVCYDGKEFWLLDRTNYDKMLVSKGALSCGEFDEIFPRTRSTMVLSAIGRKEMRDKWHAATGR